MAIFYHGFGLRDIREQFLMEVSMNGYLLGLGCLKVQSYVGPLLFLLYTDELHNHSNIADDIALHKEIVSPADCDLLQEDLSKIYEWCQVWQLKLNPLKCEAICISYKRSLPPRRYFLGSQH